MSAVFESKWGFHPVDREGFLFLKEAHGILLKAYRDVKRFIRWDRKTVYQTGPAPVHCSPFLEYGWHRLDEKEFHGYGFRSTTDKEGKRRNYYLQVLHAYQQARRPVEKPEDVRPLDIPDDLDDVVAQLKAFYSAEPVAA